MATTRAAETAAQESVVEVVDPPVPEVPGVEYDPRKMVYVYDKTTGEKLPNPVPETWLDGRFPNLSLTPSTKAGK